MASILRLGAGLGIGIFVALPATGPRAAPGTGLYGAVRKGPIMPVCRQGVPCDAPVQVTLVFSRPGVRSVRLRSTAVGTYRIALPPGFYEVRSTVTIGMTKQPKPHSVHVRLGQWDRINLFFDTGIR